MMILEADTFSRLSVNVIEHSRMFSFRSGVHSPTSSSTSRPETIRPRAAAMMRTTRQTISASPATNRRINDYTISSFERRRIFTGGRFNNNTRHLVAENQRWDGRRKSTLIYVNICSAEADGNTANEYLARLRRGYSTFRDA
jgi:hypothetical protein